MCANYFLQCKLSAACRRCAQQCACRNSIRQHTVMHSSAVLSRRNPNRIRSRTNDLRSHGIEIVCQFCNTKYEYDIEELDELYQRAIAKAEAAAAAAAAEEDEEE